MNPQQPYGPPPQYNPNPASPTLPAPAPNMPPQPTSPGGQVDEAKKKKMRVIMVACITGLVFLLIAGGLLIVVLKSGNEPAPSPQSSRSGSGLSGDPKRQDDLQRLQAVIELYGTEQHKYPTLTDMNDPAFRAKYLSDLSSANFEDPDSSSDKLATSPQPRAYSYVPAPANCDNTTTACTSYVLTAFLSNGQPYTVPSLGL